MRYNWRVKCLACVVAVSIAMRAQVTHADGEQALSVSAGWATFSLPGTPTGQQAPPDVGPDWGGAIGFSYERAISSDLSLRGEIVGGVFRGGGAPMRGATSSAVLGDAGIAFRFDVLKVVPYAFGGLGGATAGGGPIDRHTDFVVVAGVGVDWLTRRERSYGLEARIASFAGDVTIVTVGVRGTLRWGFF